MTITQTRTLLQVKFGRRNYRITKNGEIHVYGVMPNTNTEGFYLYGRVNDADTIRRIQQ